MVQRRMPRIQQIVLPLLRDALPGVQVVSWIPRVDLRDYPMLEVRRIGGLPVDITELDRPVIEMTAYGKETLADTEDLYLDARQAIWDAVEDQTVTPDGYLHSFFETMGMTQFDSPLADTWRIQGLIQLGLRPPRN